MYLYTLARYISGKEKEKIKKELKLKNDDWRSFVLKGEKKLKKPFFVKTIELKETFKVSSLKDIVDKLSKYKIKTISFKLHDSLPFHKKAILDRYLRKNKFTDKGKQIYFEAIKKNNIVYARIGIILNADISKVNYPYLAIENPTTIGEISDFVRLSKVFKTKVFLIIKNKDSKIALKKYLKENSFEKADIEIKDNYDFIKDYNLISFSLWGKNRMSDLKHRYNLLFIFGNEQRGLSKYLIDNSEYVVKIGNESSEPLRASHAASYALGYIDSKKL